MQIWKFPIVKMSTLGGGRFMSDIAMPSGAQILTVQLQEPHICLWAEVEPTGPITMKRIYLIWTGYDVSPHMQYIGTVQQGMLVYHIYQD